MLWDAFCDVPVGHIARHMASQSTVEVSPDVLLIEVALPLTSLCQVERRPIDALGSNQPPFFILLTNPNVELLIPSFPCAVGLFATPHRSCVGEDSPSTLAFSTSVNAEVSALPSWKLEVPTPKISTSVPGKSVAKDEEKKQNI